MKFRYFHTTHEWLSTSFFATFVWPEWTISNNKPEEKKHETQAIQGRNSDQAGSLETSYDSMKDTQKKMIQSTLIPSSWFQESQLNHWVWRTHWLVSFGKESLEACASFILTIALFETSVWQPQRYVESSDTRVALRSFGSPAQVLQDSARRARLSSLLPQKIDIT